MLYKGAVHSKFLGDQASQNLLAIALGVYVCVCVCVCMCFFSSVMIVGCVCVDQTTMDLWWAPRHAPGD